VIGLLITGGILTLFGLISIWLILGGILGYLAFLLIVSTNVQLNYFVDALNRNPEVSGKKVAITFDDGPVENTIKILEILDKYNVKASFFCVGKNIEKNPEIFESILQNGHFVGNHSYSHTRKIGFLSTAKIVEEIQKCDEVAMKIGGVKLNSFRPPFGVINPKTKKALEITGHKVIGWNVRSYDAVLNSKRYILNRILKKIKHGDVILLHDSNIQTVDILEQLLLFLQTNHYTILRVDNLFQIDADN
jgi:peptidoglycan/xylan/chitin deacetylase (PgdA/CDA1 family)